jgi:anti-sigma regulatory factor (Ser/Thr protein kinase)
VKDISLHLSDIVENAVKAGATRVAVSLWWADAVFGFEVADNGPGLPAAVAADPTDPYRTTRTERSVGLGLALLRAAAEQTGGGVEVHSQPGAGVRVRAAFRMTHVDAKPLGDLAGALLTAAVGWPAELEVQVGRPAETVLDTAEVRRALGGVPLTHPEVARFMGEALAAGLAPLQQECQRVFGRAVDLAALASPQLRARRAAARAKRTEAAGRRRVETR